MYRYRMRLDDRLQRLIELLAAIEDLGTVAKTISGCIDSRGHVLDMASRELAQVRQKLADLDERVQDQIRRLLRDPELRKILRYPNATVSGDHYVLPVAVNHRHKVPGVVHRTSSTGETLFIEPAGVANLSAERAVLKGEEDREVRRVLRRLSGEVARVAKPLTFALDIMARFDLITAKARFSREYSMYAPDVNSEGQLWLRQARHPLLEYLFRQRGCERTAGVRTAELILRGRSASRSAIPTRHRERSCPLTFASASRFNLLIITGPNTGGKTVCLKTTGLLCLMAQSGMHIPAGEGSSVPVFHHILADIGDEQSLEQSLSTFSSHISRIASILQIADAQSLVLLDEIGAGTDPTEGAALGRAILDGLDQIGCRAMVTTHLGDLKTYAFQQRAGRERGGRVRRRDATADVPAAHRPVRHEQRFEDRPPAEAAARTAAACPSLSAPPSEARSGIGPIAAVARGGGEGPRQRRWRRSTRPNGSARSSASEPSPLEREAEEAATLREARLRLQPKTRCACRASTNRAIVRVDLKRNIVVVSVGLGAVGGAAGRGLSNRPLTAGNCRGES